MVEKVEGWKTAQGEVFASLSEAMDAELRDQVRNLFHETETQGIGQGSTAFINYMVRYREEIIRALGGTP